MGIVVVNGYLGGLTRCEMLGDRVVTLAQLLVLTMLRVGGVYGCSGDSVFRGKLQSSAAVLGGF